MSILFFCLLSINLAVLREIGEVDPTTFNFWLEKKLKEVVIFFQEDFSWEDCVTLPQNVKETYWFRDPSVHTDRQTSFHSVIQILNLNLLFCYIC